MNTSIATLLGHKGGEVFSVTSTVTISEAVAEMNRHRVGSVLVVDGGQLTGIFTERDVLRRVVGADINPKTTPVAQVMTAGVLTVKPDTSIQHVMNVFAEKRCRHLPVVDGDRLVGLISIGDVSRWVANLHKAEAESLREYISGGSPG